MCEELDASYHCDNFTDVILFILLLIIFPFLCIASVLLTGYDIINSYYHNDKLYVNNKK